VIETEQQEKLAREVDFVKAINLWRESDKGKIAILRRNVDNNQADARGVTWFYGTLARFKGLAPEETLFLAATLLAFDKKASSSIGFGNLGSSLKLLKDKKSGEGLDRRFGILLDCDFDPFTGEGELSFRLRQTVKLLIQNDVTINWPQLIADLRRWNRPEKWVQKRWARSYYAPFDTVNSDDSSTTTSVSEKE